VRSVDNTLGVTIAPFLPAIARSLIAPGVLPRSRFRFRRLKQRTPLTLHLHAKMVQENQGISPSPNGDRRNTSLDNEEKQGSDYRPSHDENPFGDELEGETKYRTMKWWQCGISMSTALFGLMDEKQLIPLRHSHDCGNYIPWNSIASLSPRSLGPCPVSHILPQLNRS
jgi:hypothetical protein